MIDIRRVVLHLTLFGIACSCAVLFASCSESNATCTNTRCFENCVTMGRPSGVCSAGACICISPPDGDGDVDGDGDADGDSDSDADGDTDGDGDGDGDGDADGDGDTDADGDDGPVEGVDVDCPYPATSANATLQEAMDAAALPLHKLAFGMRGGLLSVGGVECEPVSGADPPQTGVTCFQAYDCNGCEIYIYNRVYDSVLDWYFLHNPYPAVAGCEIYRGFYLLRPSELEQLACHWVVEGCVSDNGSIVHFFGGIEGDDIAVVDDPDGLSWICSRDEERFDYFDSCDAVYGCETYCPTCPPCQVTLSGERTGTDIAWGIGSTGCAFSLSDASVPVECPPPGGIFDEDCRDCLDTCRELDLPGCCTGEGCICDDDCD